LAINPDIRAPYTKPEIVKAVAAFHPSSFQAIKKAITQGNWMVDIKPKTRNWVGDRKEPMFDVPATIMNMLIVRSFCMNP